MEGAEAKGKNDRKKAGESLGLDRQTGPQIGPQIVCRGPRPVKDESDKAVQAQREEQA